MNILYPLLAILYRSHPKTPIQREGRNAPSPSSPSPGGLSSTASASVFPPCPRPCPMRLTVLCGLLLRTVHPDKLKVVSGQIGKDPKICVWSSRPDVSGILACLCIIKGDHKRAIVGLSFSANGQYIATMGKDNNRSIAIYKWSKEGLPLDKMRVSLPLPVFRPRPATHHMFAGRDRQGTQR